MSKTSFYSFQLFAFIRLLARARARTEPQVIRKSAEMAWRRRWTNLLAVAVQRSFADTLLELPAPGGGGGVDGDTPSTSMVLSEARHA